MAQPQGLNVPVIITTAILTTILAGTIFEGVHAYYNVVDTETEARKWDEIKEKTIDKIRKEQVGNIEFKTSIPVYDPATGGAGEGSAMAKIIAAGGKMPSTQPSKS
jgi:coenzyme F420-reducing hydrogenase beta subunit